uniref:Uncharacterized protein n=1 Tax=Anguilla anguilla TaxID=7936 RepID=A0A0E9PZT9_ANGAN
MNLFQNSSFLMHFLPNSNLSILLYALFHFKTRCAGIQLSFKGNFHPYCKLPFLHIVPPF